MTNTDELRIGNWVNIGGLPTMIIEIDRHFANNYVPSLLTGIGLSPEILERCGFEKMKEQTFSLTVPIYSNGVLTLKKSWVDYDPEWFAFRHLTNVRLYYLHQLQNLYWCLTGQELTYTPLAPDTFKQDSEEAADDHSKPQEG